MSLIGKVMKMMGEGGSFSKGVRSMTVGFSRRGLKGWGGASMINSSMKACEMMVSQVAKESGSLPRDQPDRYATMKPTSRMVS